jgi:uncharacterized membrane protein
LRSTRPAPVGRPGIAQVAGFLAILGLFAAQAAWATIGIAEDAAESRTQPVHLLVTLLLAAAPISELRGAIPYAMFQGGFPWLSAYVVSVVGNFVPVVPVLLLLGPAEKALRRFRVFDRFFSWLFERTRRKGRLVERFEALGIIMFVAVPAPVTGAYTGAVAAYVFGIRRRLAVPAIFCGILIAGVVVTLACTGVISLWGIAKSRVGA